MEIQEQYFSDFVFSVEQCFVGFSVLEYAYSDVVLSDDEKRVLVDDALSTLEQHSKSALWYVKKVKELVFE